MAKHTRVILRAEVEALGHAGDVVEVTPGYARNFLFPQGFAYAANEANVRRVEGEKRKYQEKMAAEKVQAEALAASLAGLEIEFRAMAGEEDQLYGSVTVADIADRLGEAGHEIDRSQVKLDAPLKSLGEHEVTLRLHPEVNAPILVRILRENE